MMLPVKSSLCSSVLPEHLVRKADEEILNVIYYCGFTQHKWIQFTSFRTSRERESKNEKSALDTVMNTEHFTYLVLQVTWLFFENGNSLLNRIGLIPNRDRVCILN